MASKSIWIFNHYAISPDMAGSTRHYDLSRELVNKGYTVTIFASGFDHHTKEYVKISPLEKYRVEEVANVRFVWINTFAYKGNDWRRVLNLTSYGIKLFFVCGKFGKPDIIIGSSLHFFAPITAWLLAKKYNAKFIFEIRDLWPQTAIDMEAINSNSLTAKILYLWEKFMCCKAQKIIVLLPSAQKYLVSRGVERGKIVWLPNGVNLDLYDNPGSIVLSSEIFKTLSKFKDKFKIIYTGAHGIPNGLDVIVDAAVIIEKQSANIHFIFVGDGTEKERLKRKVKDMSLNNITFCSAIPKALVPNVLKQADCLIFSIPNFNVYKYGVSLNKSYDYLASKKPIIIAGDPMNNIVREAGAGITVGPDMPEELAIAILKLEKMPRSVLERFGVNGRLYVEKNYSTRVLGNHFDRILNDLYYEWPINKDSEQNLAQ